jgi:hypothetical protein
MIHHEAKHLTFNSQSQPPRFNKPSPAPSAKMMPQCLTRNPFLAKRFRITASFRGSGLAGWVWSIRPKIFSSAVSWR